jgi:hypothetical protein
MEISSIGNKIELDYNLHKNNLADKLFVVFKGLTIDLNI